MNDFERSQIMKLQQDGLGYKRIATATGLPVNTVKTFCRRNPVSVPAKKATSPFAATVVSQLHQSHIARANCS